MYAPLNRSELLISSFVMRSSAIFFPSSADWSSRSTTCQHTQQQLQLSTLIIIIIINEFHRDASLAKLQDRCVLKEPVIKCCKLQQLQASYSLAYKKFPCFSPECPECCRMSVCVSYKYFPPRIQQMVHKWYFVLFTNISHTHTHTNLSCKSCQDMKHKHHLFI